MRPPACPAAVLRRAHTFDTGCLASTPLPRHGITGAGGLLRKDRHVLFESVFYELSVLLIFAAGVAFVGTLLRQPLIVSFIAAGIIAGPSFLDIAHSTEHLELLAELGISLLLFVVGLKLDLHLIRTTGTVALLTGLGQVLFTSVVGYLICLALGMSPLVSVYVAIALTFSSTIIIVKLLSDKGEIDSLHGRVALGFLIVQDIVVVLVMIVLSALGVGSGSSDGLAMQLLTVVLTGVLMLAGVALFIRYGAERLLERLAGAPELMLVFVVGFAVATASLSDYMGFSKELGAFLAGVSLASTSYREVIGGRLAGLRDFMLLFFFLGLGAHLDLSTIGESLGAAVLLSLFVLIGNPFIVMVIMGTMGYSKRTGFLAGLTVAQISEFSLIFIALGAALGHVGAVDVGLVTLVGLITIGLSTYMILYSGYLYRWLEPWLGVFEFRTPYREQMGEPETTATHTDVIVFGLGRFGNNVARGLRQQGLEVLGVDFDPEVVRHWQAQSHPAVYGDANDTSYVALLPLQQARWVISTIPPHPAGITQDDPTLTLMKTLRAHGYRGRVVATVQRAVDVPRYKQAGADAVLLPFADAAHRAVEQIIRADEEEAEEERAGGTAGGTLAG